LATLASGLTPASVTQENSPTDRTTFEQLKDHTVTNTPMQLREDALAIWAAGVAAVRSDALVQQAVRVVGDELVIGQQRIFLPGVHNLAVVGCGKAGAGMAAGLEAALGPELLTQKQVQGWVNVPDDCVRNLTRIQLHGARPAGVNEPTAAGVYGAERVLELVRSLDPADLCLCLISGGGSALLPAPVAGITLADKLAVTRHLSGAGANIQQLNTVRKQLSCIKGGGLARACRAGQLMTLIISDVLGDPLDVIASGPTVADSSTPAAALAVLEKFQSRAAGICQAVFEHLERAAAGAAERPAQGARPGEPATRSASPGGTHVTNLVIGNNATAVQAAGAEAVRRGYATECQAGEQLEGEAEDLGRQLLRTAVRLRGEGGCRCVISGGEPTVRLVPASRRGLGGRNQQLVLAALDELLQQPSAEGQGLALLSGGTDGEDGPTDAAGAILDDSTVAALHARGLVPGEFLARNDAYSCFQQLDALIRTGPTHTNVCDLRVVLTAG
jgi:hydroxypyruvate reductase